jgi:exopolysaccharide production protein ExoF
LTVFASGTGTQMTHSLTSTSIRTPLSLGLAVLAMLLSLFPAAASAEDYLLGTMDRLRIRVVEWRTAEGEIRDWSTLSGDYVVGPSGNLSLPFIGEMPATGKTTAEIATAIGDGLQQKFGLLDRPEASVELAEFRPLFVSGDVQTPGRYSYAPDLTVLKAVSLAGGLRRAAHSGMRVERDSISARGNHDVLVAQRHGLVARRARLVAEVGGEEKIDFPKELQQSADGKKLMSDETAFKAARAKRLQAQLAAIRDLKTLLENEVASLEKKIASQNRQMELSKKELEGIGGLAERGLVVNARVLSIERSIAELEGKVLDMEASVLRARQDIAKADQDATNLQNDREAEIAQERQQTEADIESLSLKITMYKDLMSEAAAIDPQAAVSSGKDNAPATSFTIMRETEGKTSEIAADENTPVLPGDVIKVGVAAVPAN